MQNAEYDNCVRVENEEDAVRKAMNEYAPHFRRAAKAGKHAGIECRLFQSGVNFGKEFASQAPALLFVPPGGLGYVGLCFSADYRAVCHGRSLA